MHSVTKEGLPSLDASLPPHRTPTILQALLPRILATENTRELGPMVYPCHEIFAMNVFETFPDRGSVCLDQGTTTG